MPRYPRHELSRPIVWLTSPFLLRRGSSPSSMDTLTPAPCRVNRCHPCKAEAKTHRSETCALHGKREPGSKRKWGCPRECLLAWGAGAPLDGVSGPLCVALSRLVVRLAGSTVGPGEVGAVFCRCPACE